MLARAGWCLGICLAFAGCGDGAEGEAPRALVEGPAGDDVTGGDEDPPVEGSLPGEPLAWLPCGATECATLQVPLDHGAPGGEMISIAINRLRANPAVQYRGVIIINPGGPGVPGRPLVQQGAAALGAAYPEFDVIGFDPRGTGGSTPLPCVIDVDPAQSYVEAGVAGAIAAYASLGARCREAAGALIDHVGTNAVVEDIEHVRRALGQDVINFWAVSYATRFATAYTQAYPERVRALVLDAPVAPRADYVAFVDAQIDGLLRAHDEFFAACNSGELACPAEPEAAFSRLIEESRAMGLELAVLNNWALYLSTGAGREFLAQVLAIDSTAPQAPMMGAPADPGVMQLLASANIATNFSAHCTDNATPPLDAAQSEALMASVRERTELFVTNAVPALACSGWAVARDPVADPVFTPSTPPLIIAGQHDNLTPGRFGEELARSLGGSRLLVSDHYGHSVAQNGGLCAALAIRAYLLDLTLPEVGTNCPAGGAPATP